MPVSTEITFLTRKNTLCYDLKSVYDPKLDPEADGVRSAAVSRRVWCDFLLNTLLVTSEDLVEAFVHQQTNHLMVKFKETTVFDQYKDKALKGIKWQWSHQLVFGWSTEEILTTVKVVNLSVHVNEKKVVQYLEKFGKVVHWQKGFIRELPGVFDGTLTAKMAIAKDENGENKVIPSFIEIAEIGEYLQVFSELTNRTCFRCGQIGHIAPSCKKKLINNSDPKPEKSWSTIAAAVPEEEVNKKVLKTSSNSTKNASKEKTERDPVQMSVLQRSSSKTTRDPRKRSFSGTSGRQKEKMSNKKTNDEVYEQRFEDDDLSDDRMHDENSD